jgi:type I restriction enzyme, S subunit
MTHVPTGWAEVDLEEILAPLEDGRTIHQGWSPRCEKEPSDDNDTWGVLKTTAIQSGAFFPEHNKRLPDGLNPRPLLEVRKGDVLITSPGPRARCGVACLVRTTRPRLMLSGKMYRFRFDDEIVDPRYVEAYLLSETAMRAIDGMKTGISDSGLNLTHGRFRKLQFPLAPRAEQERILTAIEQQLARLDAAETSLVSAQRRLTALRDDALETAFAWDGSWTTLGEIAEIVGGVTKDAKRQHDPAFIDIPYLRVANVQRGYLDLTEIATIRVSQDKAAALALRPGDVLFNEGGDRDKLGRGWVWSGEIESCIHQNHVFRARLHDGFEPKFVSWHGNTFGRRWFEANGRQTTNLASLNLTTLKSFPVPAPPLDRQRRVVAELEKQLSELDATNAAIDRAHRRSSSLRRSILERAFRGELVDQDPADEPASALLERITAKRTVPKLRRKVPA